MKDSDPKSQAQAGGQPDPVSRLREQAAGFENKILRRDWIETAAAVVVAVVLAYALTVVPVSWVGKLGMAIVIGAMLEVVVVMHWTRVRGRAADPHGSPREYCMAEQDRVDRQIRLLRNVHWWYAGPPLLGAGVLAFGILFFIPGLPLRFSVPLFGVFCGGFVVVGWMIHAINQRAVRHELMPLYDELSVLADHLTDHGSEESGL